MAVTMSFTSAAGTYNFAAEEMPLFGRRIDYDRRSDQGHSSRRINCELSGFFDRKNHLEILAAYDSLINIVKANDAQFVYQDGSTIVVNKRVYIDSYSDPADWKEFQGDYNIAFHYFEEPTFAVGDLGITATYQTSSGLYTFNPPPLWQSSKRPTRPHWRGPRVTPTGLAVSDEATIVLTGRLTAPDYPQLKSKIDALHAAFSLDGTLNYGSWSNVVRVDDIQIPAVFPRDYCDYSITLKYDTPGIVEFVSRRRFSRLHAFPSIKEYPFCGTRRIRLFGSSGQTVNYYIKIRALTTAAARNLLANEAALLITSGGIELEGGTEEWDDTDPTVTLTCSKFYNTPILSNLAGT